MKAEIKAKKLVNKIISLISEKGTSKESKEYLHMENAKSCALLLCDEMIAELNDYIPEQYWNKVKEEIKKL